MEPTVMVAIIGAIEGIGVAVIGMIVSQMNKRNDEYHKRREESDQKRKERDQALYDLVFADSTGTEVLLHQAHGDHLNGNVEDALTSIHDAKSKFNKICNEAASSL